MTIRAVIIGVLLGLFVASATYFNDQIIRQTMLVGNLLPIGIFGVLVLLMIVLNPLLAMISSRLALKASELAIIAALGLAVCGWPGSGYYRYFTGNLAMPAHHIKTKANWQAANVLSYLPGGSALLGEGHVRNWNGLATTLVKAGEGFGQPTLAGRVWSVLPLETQRSLRQNVTAGHVPLDHHRTIVNSLNEVLNRPDLYLEIDPARGVGSPRPEFAGLTLRQPEADLATTTDRRLTTDDIHRINRAAMVAALPEFILPQPQGDGVLLLGGRGDTAVVDPLMQGGVSPPKGEGVTWLQQLPPMQVPWGAWAPAIVLWGGIAACIGLASLGIVMVVHPQWSRRELLAYPIARFVEESAQRTKGHWLPDIARNRLFWYGVLAVSVLHLVNGLKAWYPSFFLSIPLSFDFGPLRTIFPNAAKVSSNWGLFSPRIYLSVVAFAFFLTTEVSLSLGLSLFIWVFFGSLLVANGVALRHDWSGAENQNFLFFGGWVGIGMVILYTGRRHYWDVIKATVGLPKRLETPGYSVWGSRLALLAFVGAVALLAAQGLDWMLGVPLILIVLLIFTVIARVNAETGVFFVQAGWMPMAMIAGFIGIEAIGPTAFVIMAIASVMLVIDPREAIMPFLVNGLQIGERTGNAAPQRIAPLIGIMVLVGLATTIFVGLSLQYRYGMNIQDLWMSNSVSTMPFDTLSKQLGQMASAGTLESASQVSGLDRLGQIRITELWPWFALGVGLVFVFTVARLRLPWWPLHPVIFVFWGSYPAAQFAASFLVGWAIKAAVVRLTGAKGFNGIKPVMVGIIAGELFAGLVWMTIGAIYYFNMGESPPNYSILPG